MLTTKNEFARAFDRLRRRDPEALAAFIMSLVHDLGPIGAQVRTFIVGDDVVETAESLRQRIRSLRVATEYDHRHSRGKEIGASLSFIVESIESLVLPVSPQLAFALLVTVFEADGVAMENCGDYHWEVECALERAAGVMAEAGKSLPAAEVRERIKGLMAADSYRVRGVLAGVVADVNS